MFGWMMIEMVNKRSKRIFVICKSVRRMGSLDGFGKDRK